MTIRLTATALLATVAAMGQSTPSSEARIRALEEKVRSLEVQLETAFRWTAEIDNKWHDSVDFDPTSPAGFQRLDTETGPLFVKLGTVEPYLDGYKVNLSIGNPSSVPIGTYELSVKWAARRKPDEGRAKWIKGIQRKVFDEREDLKPGEWTGITFNLPATTASEFGYIEIAIDAESIHMKESR